MTTVDIAADNPFAIGSETVIHLPSGLLGFEQYKKYLLRSVAEEEPFYRLQVLNEPAISFFTLSPFAVLASYEPDIPAEDTRFLGIECPDDVFLLNIVTLRPHGRATINLKGPIVINRFSLIGKQVVIANAADYSLQHPLPTE